MTMRRLIWVAASLPASVLLLGLAAAEPPKLTEEERKALTAESTKVGQETQRLYREGKVAEAIAMCLKVLEVDRKLYGNEHEEIASDLLFMGACYQFAEDFATADKYCQDGLALYTKLFGPDHWRTGDGRRAVAEVKLVAALSPEERKRHRQANVTMTETMRLDSAGKYKEALALGVGLEAEMRALVGEGHRDHATVVNWVASLHDKLDHKAERDAARQRAVALMLQAVGGTHPEYATMLNNLAADHDKKGDYAQAEKVHLQALEIREKTVGKDHVDYAQSLNNLAGLYKSLNNYARAEAMHKQALEIKKRAIGEGHPDYAISLGNLAMLYVEQGDFVRAGPLLRQAVEINKGAFGENHPRYGFTLTNLAYFYAQQGDYFSAMPLYVRALDLFKKTLGERHSLYASALSNLGAAYRQANEIAKAEALYREAIEIRKKVVGELHPDYASTLTNLAVICRQKGDYAEAERLNKQAIEIVKKALGETHPAYVQYSNNLATVYRAQGNYEGAEAIYQEVSKIALKVMGESHTDYAHFLHNFASLLQARGKYDDALPIYAKALEIDRAHLALAADSQAERQQLMMLKAYRSLLDNFVTLGVQAPQFAGPVWDAVLSWKGAVLGRQRTMRAAANRPELAELAAELQKTTSRLATLGLAPGTSAQKQARQQQIETLSTRKDELERQLAVRSREYRQARIPITRKEIAEALPERSAIVDYFEFRFLKQAQEGTAGGWQRESRLAAFVGRRDGSVHLIDVGLMEPVVLAIEKWRKDQGASPEARQAANDLRERIWLPVESQLSGVTTVLISPDGDLGKLPFGALPGKEPGRYLIEERAIAVVPMPQTVALYVGEEPQVSAASQLLLVGGVTYDRRPAALQPSPVQPAAGHALPMGEGLLAGGTPAPQGRAPRDGESMFAPLAGTEAEMAAIEGLFRNSFAGAGPVALKAAAASQESVVEAATNTRYVHMATHGYFASPRFKSALGRSMGAYKMPDGEEVMMNSLGGLRPGLLSGLALAGANEPTEEDDGILTAEEVGSLNLSKTELVVLSACETGLGNSAGGEGLLGLQRSFQAAGARSVAASMWSVPDQATKALMVRFYENLWKKKMSKLEALREAQLWMLEHGAEQPEIRREVAGRGLAAAGAESGDPRTTGVGGRESQVGGRLPVYYWGAWVLSGDWR